MHFVPSPPGIMRIRPSNGFCFFNNVAIGAHYLRQQYALERVAIIDWDVHHGNGTQTVFIGMSTYSFAAYTRHHTTHAGS